MPRVFKAGSYWIYFWSDENRPIEPVHVHIAEGSPKPGATKVWITRSKKCLLDNNDSDIDLVILRRLMRVIEARADEILAKWEDHFGMLTILFFVALRKGRYHRVTQYNCELCVALLHGHYFPRSWLVCIASLIAINLLFLWHRDEKE